MQNEFNKDNVGGEKEFRQHQLKLKRFINLNGFTCNNGGVNSDIQCYNHSGNVVCFLREVVIQRKLPNVEGGFRPNPHS